MKNREREKPRTDRPSGRQGPDNPLKENSVLAAESLHQGQGPDFPTQDRQIQEDNPAIKTQRTDYPAKRNSGPQAPPDTMKEEKKNT